MFIILEGIDGCGKTSLAKKLEDRIKQQEPFAQVSSVHFGPPSRNVFDIYAKDYEYYRPNVFPVPQHIISDRFHWSNPVYSNLYRGNGKFGELGEEGLFWLELFLKSRGACVWLMENTPSVIRERLQDRGEDYLNFDHIEQVLDHFKEISEWSSLTAFTPEDVDEMLYFARLKQNQAQPLNEFESYVGSPSPDVLVVGDRQSHPSKYTMAFCPDESEINKQLIRNVMRSGLSVGMCYSDDTDLLKLVDTIGPSSVVSLSKISADSLDAVGISYATDFGDKNV